MSVAPARRTRPAVLTASKSAALMTVALIAAIAKSGSQRAVAANYCNPDTYRQSNTWGLSDGASGYGAQSYNLACDVFQARGLAITQKSANTDNKIGARMAMYDRCDPSQPYTQQFDTGWTYSGANVSRISTPYGYGAYQDCSPSQNHEYDWQSHHLFTNNNPYENQTFVFDS